MSDPKRNEAFPSMVSNRAAIDRFYAPDSTSSRPNPESNEDRPRTPNQFIPTATEEALNRKE